MTIMDATVVSGMGLVLARLMQGQALYLALGSGLATWDDLAEPPQAITGQSALQNELGRVLATVEFLDVNGATSDIPTTTIRAYASFDNLTATGTCREIGLFVFATPSDPANSIVGDPGIMVEVHNFIAIVRPSDGSASPLAREMRVTFLV